MSRLGVEYEPMFDIVIYNQAKKDIGRLPAKLVGFI
jgi:hypothetical protein